MGKYPRLKVISKDFGMDENVSPNIGDLIKFQIARRVIHISKNFLEMLENLLQNRNITKEEFLKMRKIVLDKNGDARRELEEFIDKFDISVKTVQEEENWNR